MDFSLILSPARDANAHAWTAEQLDALAQQLRALDPDLGEPMPGDDGSISVVARKGIGLDWHLETTRIVVSPQVGGIKPARAERVFNTLLSTLRALLEQHAMTAHSPTLQQDIDIDRDHEALAQAWLAHCHGQSKLHLETTRQGSHVNLVAVLVLLAILLAASQMPEAWHPLITLAVAVPLAFLVLLWFRARAARRARGE